ncbi:hypothetical protein IFM5058_10512 [Aspergillus udagawae]|nr:hypothetical protein IFM5058_10512 [Aspergillus udagawae]
MQARAIEDYPSGYPRFSALIAADDSFRIFRRFSNLRYRLLLLKQNSISTLEEQLQQLDRDETATIFLGSARRDRNQERINLLSKISNELSQYDEMIERNARIARFIAAKPRDIASLQNWTIGTGCISREDTEYLVQIDDLLTLEPTDDEIILNLEKWVEDQFIELCGGIYRVSQAGWFTIRTLLLTKVSAKRLARGILSSLITILLLLPLLACNFLHSVTVRVVIVAVAIVAFIATISGVAKARSVEVFVASATYATVLTVFMTGGSPGTAT